MKVTDLIDKLKTMPAGAPVLVQGYEDGFDSTKAVKEISVVKNPNASDYNGEYDEAGKNDKGAVEAVVIMGNRR
ncbi:MAG: hypothetical protein A2Z81_06410 [Omnitrophica WOR_2 bacterium GWA2_45_18]|nr:MAG: hypothetical protein A2Z81_06410 [Omnitrophica WOR_2 bacterium GWA2_45_18]